MANGGDGGCVAATTILVSLPFFSTSISLSLLLSFFFFAFRFTSSVFHYLLSRNLHWHTTTCVLFFILSSLLQHLNFLYIDATDFLFSHWFTQRIMNIYIQFAVLSDNTCADVHAHTRKPRLPLFRSLSTFLLLVSFSFFFRCTAYIFTIIIIFRRRFSLFVLIFLSYCTESRLFWYYFLVLLLLSLDAAERDAGDSFTANSVRCVCLHAEFPISFVWTRRVTQQQQQKNQQKSFNRSTNNAGNEYTLWLGAKKKNESSLAPILIYSLEQLCCFYAYIFALAERMQQTNVEFIQKHKKKTSTLLLQARTLDFFVSAAFALGSFFHSFNVIVAWFLFLFSFSFFTACKVFDDNFTFSFTVRHYYLYMPFYQFAFVAAASTLLSLTISMSIYEFEFVTVVNASLWLISWIRSAVSSRHQRWDMIAADGNLSSFGRCMEDVIIFNLHRCVRYENHNRDDK